MRVRAATRPGTREAGLANITAPSATAATAGIGTVVFVCGSLLAYAVGRTGARALVDRYGRYVLLSHSHLDKAEGWFSPRGEWTVLCGRVLQVILGFHLPPGRHGEDEPREVHRPDSHRGLTLGDCAHHDRLRPRRRLEQDDQGVRLCRHRDHLGAVCVPFK